MTLDDLTYLQKIRIIQQEVSENTYIFDILNDEDIWEEIRLHPNWVKGNIEDNPLIWKDLMNDAEYMVKAKYAFLIYSAVKDVLDKGEELK